MDKRYKQNIRMLCFFCAAGLLWHLFRIFFTGGSIGGITAKNVFTYLIFAPVAEELFFRGFIQNWLGDRLEDGIMGISYANLTASFLFSAVHLFSWTVSHSLLVFIPSLALGYVYDRTGSLIYVILLHSLYNLNFFIL